MLFASGAIGADVSLRRDHVDQQAVLPLLAHKQTVVALERYLQYVLSAVYACQQLLVGTETCGPTPAGRCQKDMISSITSITDR
jgi:hypothetical protein